MNVLIFILGIFGALYGLWFLGIGVLGTLKGYKTPPVTPPRHRFAVLVPARNEVGVVGYLVKSLMNQEYPRDMYDVFVIPNGCTDNTAEVSAAAGARILECTVPTGSKGDVLRFAFEKIPAMGNYDAYCILDADNLAAPGFLRAANDMLCAGWEIAQGHRDSKNPADSWVAGDTSVFFWMMNRFYNRARNALGMSAALNGTGIVMSKKLVERLGWNMKSLTEDLEFSGLCAANGVKIGFMESGVVYDEQPVSLKDSMVQRRRWFSGNMQCLRIHFWNLVKKHSLHAVDMLFIFGGCVMQAAGIISGVYSAVKIISALIRGEVSLGLLACLGAAALIIAWAACAIFAYVICRLEKKDIARMRGAIFMFPVFMVTWFAANLWAMVTPPPKWTHIEHVRGTDRPE